MSSHSIPERPESIKTNTKVDAYGENPCYKYMVENSLREPEILTRLTQATKEKTSPGHLSMMSHPLQGQFFTVLARLLNMKKAIEVGVFTGYNALNLALAMPDDGKIVCCEVNEEFINIGKPFFKEANVDHKMDIRIAHAAQTMDELIAAGEAGSYDFVFIDADKEDYDDYYEKSLQLVRVGGIIAIDNVFGFGGAWSEERRKEEPAVCAIHELNQKIHKDKRVQISMMPVTDGFTLALKL